MYGEGCDVEGGNAPEDVVIVFVDGFKEQDVMFLAQDFQAWKIVLYRENAREQHDDGFSCFVGLEP